MLIVAQKETVKKKVIEQRYYIHNKPHFNLIRANKPSRLLTWRPDISGRRETDFHSLESYAIIRHFRQVRAKRQISR
jgi:hypothetical protein